MQGWMFGYETRILQLDWMFWTYPTIIFLGSVIALFAALIVIDLNHRSLVPTKGFLPYYTTRGDRVFLGITFVVIIGVLWLIFVPLPIEYSVIPALAAFIITAVWG